MQLLNKTSEMISVESNDVINPRNFNFKRIHEHVITEYCSCKFVQLLYTLSYQMQATDVPLLYRL